MQTNYEHVIGVAGELADCRMKVTESYAAKTEIAFGVGVKADSADPENIVALATGTADIFHGVSQRVANAAGKHEATDTVPVLRNGVIWVPVTKAVAVGTAAYVDVEAGNGYFTDAEDDGAGTPVANIATGGTFRSATAAAGFAKLQVNL